MKNVTKILTAAVLCAALFASTQRTNALGSNPAFWPGDEANIAAFPAQINSHTYAQFIGVGATATATDLVFNQNGTAWSLGFTEGDGDTWFNLGWGKNGMGVNAQMTALNACLEVTHSATRSSDHMHLDPQPLAIHATRIAYTAITIDRESNG